MAGLFITPSCERIRHDIVSKACELTAVVMTAEAATHKAAGNDLFHNAAMTLAGECLKIVEQLKILED